MKITDRGTGQYCLQLICCGRDDGRERFQTWTEADEFRKTYCDDTGHDRAAILTVESLRGEGDSDGEG